MPNGLALAIILLVIMLFMAYILSILINFLSPFYTTKRKYLKEIINTFKLNRDDSFVDLGSGDGRVVFSVYSKYKCSSHGYEISPIILVWSKLLKFIRFPFNGKVKILEESFFRKDLSQYTSIYCCLPEDLLAVLENKFKKELKPGTKVFTLKNKLPNKNGTEVKIDDEVVYQYTF